MSIRFSSQTEKFEPHDTERLRLWLTEVIKRHGKSVGNINYLFSDDEQMLQANIRYLNHDTYTDIITFDYVSGGLVSGDILVSIDRVGENAMKYSVSLDEELRRDVVHGVLHLLGQGDKTDVEAAKMRRREADALALWDELFHEERMS